MDLLPVRLADRIRVSSEGFTKRVVYDGPDVLAFVLTFAPGQSVPEHRHDGSTVLLQCLRGTPSVRAGGRDVRLNAGEVLAVPGSERLSIRNDGTDVAALYVTLSPNPSDRRFAREVR